MAMRIPRNRIILRLVALPAVILALISLTACPIVIPPLVHYYKTKDAYVGTVTLNAKAEEVYSEIVSLAEERVKEGKVKITNKAKQILYLEVTDGVQTAGIKVNKLSDKLSQMVITADIPPTEGESKEREKEREKELTVKIMRNICEGLNQNCQLVEQ